MRHRRLGQPVEGAPATLAAEPQQPVRATPANDLAAGAVRTPLSLDPLKTRRSKRVLPTARAFPGFCESNVIGGGFTGVAVSDSMAVSDLGGGHERTSLDGSSIACCCGS
jgi:hypothetical protein